MGQQQLLLIVLGTIVVGIAVVVGINLFNANQQQQKQQPTYTDNGQGTVELYPDNTGDISVSLKNWREKYPERWQSVTNLYYVDTGLGPTHYRITYRSGGGH